MKITKKIGMILLAVWLILMGLSMAFKLSFEGIHLVQGGLAIAAGAFLLVDR
jgi:hypothetical protein